MTPEEIRNFVNDHPQYHPDTTTALMLQEIAAQLAEANQYLKLLATPIIYTANEDETRPVGRKDAEPVETDDAPRAEQRWSKDGSSAWCVVLGSKVFPFGNDAELTRRIASQAVETLEYLVEGDYPFTSDPTVKEPEPLPLAVELGVRKRCFTCGCDIGDSPHTICADCIPF